MKTKLLLSVCGFLIATNIYGQLTTSGYLFFNENRGLSTSRNWVIRQNNAHEGDFQIGTGNSNTSPLPDFNLNPDFAKLTISSNGNVGINTNIPQTNFEVVGFGQIIRNLSSTGYSTFRLYNDQNNPVRALEIDYSGSAYAGSTAYGSPVGEGGTISTTGAFPLSLGTNNTNRITILSNGNVGVGTTGPADQMEIVNGNRKVGFNTIISGVSNGGTIALSRPDDAAKTMYIGASASPADDNVIFSQGGSSELRFVSNGGPYAPAGFGFYNNVSIQSAFGSAKPSGVPVMKIDGNGNVGIGTGTPDAKLAVSGQVHAQEVKVSITVPGPDYVFEKDYHLTSLEDIKNYIDQHKHLPEVPSAKEMEKNGVQLGEMNMLLLKKIEELTLYILEQDKRINKLEQVNKNHE